jgi:hypothetical protein
VRSNLQSEFLCRSLAGVQAPEIDGEVTSHGHDGFFALGAGGASSLGQKTASFLDRRVLGLETDQAPGTFHQGGAESRVAMFGHLSLHAFSPAAVFAGTEAGAERSETASRQAAAPR